MLLFEGLSLKANALIVKYSENNNDSFVKIMRVLFCYQRS